MSKKGGEGGHRQSKKFHCKFLHTYKFSVTKIYNMVLVDRGLTKGGTKKSGQWFILLIICYERENIKFTNPPGGQCLYIHEFTDWNFLDMPLSILVCW